ncbi:SNF2 family N-terminal domain-containing protein [Hypoxylon fuscum]|nr:SNF2 family N-terminal domain-containing protein [Hypoxylon fuscum]
MEWAANPAKRPRLEYQDNSSAQQDTCFQAPYFCEPVSTAVGGFSIDYGMVNTRGLTSNEQTAATEYISFGLCYSDHFESASLLKETLDVVCFGSIVSFKPTNVRCTQSQTKLILGTSCQLLGQLDHIPCGWLAPKDFEVLELFRRDGIEFDLLWAPSCSTFSNENVANNLWITLYGERDLASDLGEALQELGIYLQDPIHAERDAPYSNPHRFHNNVELRTYSVRHCFQGEVNVETLNISLSDILAESVPEASLPETEGSPLLLTCLKPHQKTALTFMTRRECGWRYSRNVIDVWSTGVDQTGEAVFINNINNSSQSDPPLQFQGGILADEMGLGKSLTMISLIAQDESRSTSSLLVVPSSLLRNWEFELGKHLPPSHFSWRRHYGNQRLRDVRDMAGHNVILTTYSTLATEWRNKGPDSFLFTHQWHRVILDEAHCIKDPSTVTAKAAYTLNADRRWAVTGTLIQNRLSELCSLFRFLQINPYSDKEAFDEDITSLWSSGKEEEAVSRLKKLLNFIMLRRSNDILHLPKRTDQRIFLKFDPDEQRSYDYAKEAAIRALDDILESSHTRRGYINALSKINCLRMICNLGNSAESKLVNGKLQSSTPLGFLAENVIWDAQPAEKALDEFTLLNSATICTNCQTNIVLNQGTPSSLEDESINKQPPFAILTECLRLWCGPCTNLSLANYCACTPRCTHTRIEPHSLSDISPSSQSPFPATQYTTKIRALVNDLNLWGQTDKSVVFSFWKSTLDLANLALTEAGIKCVQIDGKVPKERRHKILQDFSANNETRVLLLTLSCGAVGLTLTAASHVCLLEPQWNPSIEEQALARVYRLGQTRDVTTVRFIMDESIEKYVLDIQDNKKELINLLFMANGFPEGTRNRLRGLRSLLK